MKPKIGTIAISGKGGTGKTAISAMMIKVLSRDGGPKLMVIDADPAISLPSALGIRVRKTVSDLREKLYYTGQNPDVTPGNVPLDMMLEYQIDDIVVETPEFNLLAMGRSEGAGCYCLLNDLLRYLIEKLSKQFDTVIIDCEAGMEHLSRRTLRDVNFLFVITDPTRRGMETAENIKKIAQDLEIKVGRTCLILNKITEEDKGFLEEQSAEFTGIIPRDNNIIQYDRLGTPILDLPDDSPALIAVQDILSRTLL